MNVPTFFSRIYETENAFREVVKCLEVDSFPLNRQTMLANSIVEKTMFLLEFIYCHGEWINVTKLNIQRMENNLHCSSNTKHAILADIIKEDVKPLVGYENEWYLFEYDGQILGGSSPLTLIYTSPNTFENKEYEESISVPFERRSWSFILWLYSNINNMPESLRRYLDVYRDKVFDYSQRNEIMEAAIVRPCKNSSQTKTYNDTSGHDVVINEIQMCFISDVDTI